MRLVLLTPGTGSFFCGTCVRDNALTLALRSLGHDARMVPMYLPPTLDEASGVESSPRFYGGVNVYQQQVAPVFRKTPRWLDAALDGPAALASASKRAGSTDPKDLGPLTLSMLRGEDGNQKKELDRLVSWLKNEARPDAVLLSNALLMGLGGAIKRATGARLACTLQGEDTFLDALPEPDRTASWEEVKRRSADFDALIAVSRCHADLMIARAGLPPERVHVVHNGITLDGYPTVPTAPAVPTVGFLSRMCAAKGLDTLVEAFCLLGKRHPGVRLAIAGAQTPGDRAFVAAQEARLKSAGLRDRASFHPNLDRAEKINFLKSLSVFSVPALYGESFGLYLLEALAAGVPVVQPRHAAFPEVLAATGGGLLYDDLTPAGLASALESLLTDPTRATKLGREGQANVHQNFSVERMAQEVAKVLNK